MNKYYYAGAEVLAKYTGGNTQYYIHDRLGSVRLAIVGTTSSESYNYTPFGEDMNSVEYIYSHNPFKFTGQWYDHETGQYYNRARMYDPQLGRFTSRDPIRGKFPSPLTLHAYLYCVNDPTNMIDPDGEYAYMAARIVIGGIIGGFSSYKSSGGDTWATVVGSVCGMFSGVISDPIMGMVVGSILGGASSGFSEYRQYHNFDAFTAGFMAGFGGGLVGGGLGLRVGASDATGMMSYLASQGIGGIYSWYLGMPVDPTMNLMDHSKKRDATLEYLNTEWDAINNGGN